MPQADALKTETREMSMLTLRGAFDPTTFNAEKRTMDLVWTTGAKGLRRGWLEDYYEELDVSSSAIRMDRLNSGAPILAAHDAYSLDSVLGVVERAWIADGKGYATVRFSERGSVQETISDIQTGILRNVSVGYNVYRYEISQTVDSELDTYRAVDWEPMEISIVPIGFDSGAQTRAATDKHTHNVTLITRSSAAITTDEGRTMAQEQAAAAEASRAAEQQAAATAREEGIKAERERQTQIRSAVQKAGLKDQDGAFASALIDKGVSVDAARAAIIDEMHTRQQAEQKDTRSPHFEMGQTSGEKWVEGARAWLFEKANVRRLFKDGDKMDGAEFRGMTLLDLARESLERDGVKTRGLSKMELAGKALTYRSAYNGTSDFSVLLETALHKTLLGAFNITTDTWSRFCAVGSVSDFRASNRYRLGSFGVLDAVKEHGEFKQKAIPDGAKESITASTKGNIIALSRQAMINDDMGVFNSLATSLGRAAKLSIEVDVYAALALNTGAGPALNDGNPIFYNRGTGKNNISTGAAISAAAFDADRVALASLKDISSNEYLDLRPQILLLPLSLGSTAREINKMEFNDDSQKNQRKPNSVRDLFKDIIDTPRLSGTRRYMFADPQVAPVLEVAFLDGQQQPFMDNQQGWRVDGVEWKVRMDYGVGGVGYQGAVMNAGV